MGKVGRDVLEGFVGHEVDRLDLQDLHETLGLGVVAGIATPAHQSAEAALGKELPVEL